MRRRRKRRREKNVKYLILILIIFLLIMFVKKCVHKGSEELPSLVNRTTAFNISGDILYKLKGISQATKKDYPEVVMLYLLKNDFNKNEESFVTEEELYEFCNHGMGKVRKKYNRKVIKELHKVYQQILGDIDVFPIPYEYDAQYIYADSWGASRDYGGQRKHLGTDIIDVNNRRGEIPIVSMTDGVIEQIGWNEKGGWRVGVRAPSGAYFYYAHLDSFSHEIKKGIKVKGGQCLGYMGDSGYGKEPGTVGNFPVHLHLGILLDISFMKEEVWINPYNLLKLGEHNKMNWSPQDENS